MDFDYASLDSCMAGAVITQVPTLVRRAPSAWIFIKHVSILLWWALPNFKKVYCLQGFWTLYKALMRRSGLYKGSIRLPDAFCTRITPPRPLRSSLLGTIRVVQLCFFLFSLCLLGFGAAVTLPSLQEMSKCKSLSAHCIDWWASILLPGSRSFAAVVTRLTFKTYVQEQTVCCHIHPSTCT